MRYSGNEQRGREERGDIVAGNGNGNGDLAFAADLFKAADKLRGNLEPSEYKHVALGLIFLKYLSRLWPSASRCSYRSASSRRAAAARFAC